MWWWFPPGGYCLRENGLSAGFNLITLRLLLPGTRVEYHI